MNKPENTPARIIGAGLGKISKCGFPLAIIVAFALTVIIESLGRRDFLGGFVFMVEHPVWFTYNLLIVLLTLSVAFFFRKRVFFFSIISLIWLTLGVINFIVQSFRTTPFSSIDLQIFTIGIFTAYVGIPGIIGIVLLIISVVALSFFLYKKSPAQKTVVLFKSLLMLLTVAVMLTCVTVIGIATENINNDIDNMNEAYEDYGFAYSFARTLVEKGVVMPEDYGKAALEEVSENISVLTGAPDKMPNVIILQLESFFDMKYLKNITLSADPCPVFTYLKESCVSGLLSVPYVGAGTVNTEFEILTGMSLDYFGFGEYPYKSVLQSRTCESLAYILKNKGLTTTALHNYEGTFYDRHIVYANLGFDRFVPMEYMSGCEKNELGWAKDSVLLPYIKKTLSTSEGVDFIYGVTVQTHGRYPAESDAIFPIAVSGNLTDAERTEFEYYASEQLGVDAFLGALITYLSSLDEPTVLVLYGDHMPCLAFDENDLTTGDMYTTEYIIWSNYGLTGEDKDLEAWQLSSYFCELIGVNDGVLPRFHRLYSEADNYVELHEKLEYDMLYGENYITGGENKYEKCDMLFGCDDINVEKTTVIGNSLYVTGSGFTEFSVIYTDGIPRETSFVNSETLVTIGLDVRYAVDVSVRQVSAGGYVYE